MNRFKPFLFYIGLYVLTGCGQGTPVQDNDIVIVCADRDAYQDTVYIKGIPVISDAPVFTLKDAEARSEEERISHFPDDTITIRNSAERAILTFRYNPLEQMDAVVRGGDTLLIGHENGIPYIRAKGGYRRGMDYDREKICRYGLTEGFRPETVADNPFIIINGTEDYTVKAEEARDILFRNLDDESLWLDSLHTAGVLDDLEYSYFKKRNRYGRLYRETGEQTPEQMRDILASYSDTEYRNEPFWFYRQYMDDIFKRTYYTDWITSAQSSDPDYGKIFDRITADTLVSGPLKDTHLYGCMEAIAGTSSHADGKLYYGKAMNEIRDTALLGQMQRKYGELFSKELKVDNDLRLLGAQGDTLMLSDLIRSLSGKVVYMDIWASWCEPCRREIPASLGLHEEYAGKGVEFVYIANNDREDKWREALSQTGLDRMEHVYLVLNPRDNTWAKELEVNTIPRYMIYDSAGILVNANAPRPSSSGIRPELERYLDGIPTRN